MPAALPDWQGLYALGSFFQGREDCDVSHELMTLLIWRYLEADNILLQAVPQILPQAMLPTVAVVLFIVCADGGIVVTIP